MNWEWPPFTAVAVIVKAYVRVWHTSLVTSPQWFPVSLGEQARVFKMTHEPRAPSDFICLHYLPLLTSLSHSDLLTRLLSPEGSRPCCSHCLKALLSEKTQLTLWPPLDLYSKVTSVRPLFATSYKIMLPDSTYLLFSSIFLISISLWNTIQTLHHHHHHHHCHIYLYLKEI